MITYYKALDKWLLAKPGRRWFGDLNWTTYSTNINKPKEKVVVIHARTLSQMNWLVNELGS